ncbi:hypothetical protein GCM10027291_06330 [Telluribacter humicola]|jgi:hypothetical protein
MPYYCTKKPYPSQLEAQAALGKIKIGLKNKPLKKAYCCEFCGFYHVTSMTKGDLKKAKRGETKPSVNFYQKPKR